MNVEDREFWIGFIRGIMAVEHELRDPDIKNKTDALISVNELKSRVERLLNEDMLVFLKQYDPYESSISDLIVKR